MRIKNKGIKFIILAIFIGILITGCGSKKIDLSDTKIDGKLKVHFIDVGQADSILIEQEEKFMLIDAGNNDDSDLVINYLKNNGVKKLEYLIGTHPHEDHIGGLDKVIDAFDIGKIVMPNVTHTTKTFKDVVKSARAKGLKFTKPVVGEEFDLGEARMVVLAPNRDKYNDLNDYSVVIRLKYGKSSFMFTGDAESHSEKEIIATGLELKSQVLKSGHHGSRTSSSEAFIKKVKPQYVVISCGKDNDYGHPHKETVEKYKRMGIEMLRTDDLGTIVCISDGENIMFRSERGEDVGSVSEDNSSDDTGMKDDVDKAEESMDYKLQITNVDKIKELVYIKNNGDKAVNLDGMKLISTRGNQELQFSNIMVEPNQIITVTSGDEPGDIVWGKKNIWNNKEEDLAILKDKKGKIISKTER